MSQTAQKLDSLSAESGPAGTGPTVAGGSTRLALTQLTVTEFRCYRQAGLAADETPVVLIGPNGAGKTNLLEAISLLAPGRGLRRARLSELQRRRAGIGDGDEGAGSNEAGWSISARVNTAEGPMTIGTGQDPEAPASERRLIRIDGETARTQTALGERLAVLWLTPQQDRLFIDSRSQRLRFFDRLVYGFDGAHAGRLAQHEKAVRERNRLLETRGDDRWLTAVEEQIAERAIAIAAARQELAMRLDSAASSGVGPFPAPSISVIGMPEELLRDRPALAAEDRIREALRNARPRDRAAGTASIGAHRSDFHVRHRARDVAAEECSTGEQKALLLTLVLAHARLVSAAREMVPLLLLDEVAAHLDEARRAALYDEITGLGTQAWLTGTDRHLFQQLDGAAQFFRVVDATIYPAS